MTKAAASEARYSAAWAMSSGRPGFFTGCATWPFWATMAAIWSATSRVMPIEAPKIEVAIRPGQIAFTRMPCCESWAAATRLIWITAALAEE